MAHASAHQHDHRHFSAARPSDRRRLTVALWLIVALMLGELAAGIVAHSLALLSDAGHMLADAGALGFSLAALALAARPARGAMTFGFVRAETLSAQANGLTLLIFAALIVYEALRRLFTPPHVHGTLVLVVALAGALVNALAAWTLAGADRRSLNVEGSFRHVLVDLYGFIATAAAAAVIIATGFQRADAIASLLISLLMARSGYALVRSSARVFLEAAPEGLDPDAIGRALVAQAGVVEVHDLHVWELTSGFPALAAHVLVGADSDCHRARRQMEALLAERFGVEHTTLQVDHAGGDLLQIAPGADARRA